MSILYLFPNPSPQPLRKKWVEEKITNLPLLHFSFVAHHHHQSSSSSSLLQHRHLSLCFVGTPKRLLCGWGSEELRILLTGFPFSVADNL